MKPKTSILNQGIIILLILLVSKGVERITPFPMPASVVGLVLLFTLLCLGWIKLDQVETVGNALTGQIGLFFVPAGISAINSMGLIAKHPILILGLIIISTFCLLIFTGKTSEWIMNLTTREKVKKNTYTHLHLGKVKGEKSI